jgi:hypothetical protein
MLINKKVFTPNILMNKINYLILKNSHKFKKNKQLTKL